MFQVSHSVLHLSSATSSAAVTLCRTAVAVANQQQDSEVTALRAVISLANETLFNLVNATIVANYTNQLAALDTAYSRDPNNVCPQACLSPPASLSPLAHPATVTVVVTFAVSYMQCMFITCWASRARRASRAHLPLIVFPFCAILNCVCTKSGCQ